MHHNWQSYDVWFLRYGARRTKFFFFLGNFLTFYPLTIHEIKILKKMQKKEKEREMPGDIIILHKCTINNNHAMYVSWYMEATDIFFFVISEHFLPFSQSLHPTTQKIKILKTWQKTWRYHHFAKLYLQSWALLHCINRYFVEEAEWQRGYYWW